MKKLITIIKKNEDTKAFLFVFALIAVITIATILINPVIYI